MDHLPLLDARSSGVGKGLVRGEGDLQGLRSCRSFTPLRRTQQWRLWGWEGCAHVDHLPVSDARSSGVCGAGKGQVKGEGDLQGLRSCRVDHLPLVDARSCGVCRVGKGFVRAEGDLQGLHSCRSPTFQMRKKICRTRSKN